MNHHSSSENYTIILFFNSNSLLFQLNAPQTYEGKNHLFQQLILQNSLHLSPLNDSYRSFTKAITLELEDHLLAFSNIFTNISKYKPFPFYDAEEPSSFFDKIRNSLIFLNNLFVFDENSMEFSNLNSLKLLNLILELLTRFFQYSISEKDAFENKDHIYVKDLSDRMFETLNLALKKGHYSSLETSIEKSLLERMIFLIDFGLIEENVLRVIFLISSSCSSDIWLKDFIEKNQILRLLPGKIEGKNLDFILMAIEMYYIFPMVKGNEEDLDFILNGLKKRVIIEINSPGFNMNKLIEQIYLFCYREYEKEDKNKDKSPESRKKVKKKTIKEDLNKKMELIENVTFVEVFK